MKSHNPVLAGYGTTIFTVMSALAVEHDAINLGQGFPDTDGPEDIRQVAADTLSEGPNQYPPMLDTPISPCCVILLTVWPGPCWTAAYRPAKLNGLEWPQQLIAGFAPAN